jgi:hypothetical protein
LGQTDSIKVCTQLKSGLRKGYKYEAILVSEVYVGDIFARDFILAFVRLYNPPLIGDLPKYK